jgi:hypothetical protein
MIIKLLLVVGVLGGAIPLLLGQGARNLAIRRILLVLFMMFAVASIFRPDLWSRLASLVGVGRGTDLVLYALVVAFLGFVMRSYGRNRALEIQVTRLARRIALDEAGPAAGRREGDAH